MGNDKNQRWHNSKYIFIGCFGFQQLPRIAAHLWRKWRPGKIVVKHVRTKVHFSYFDYSQEFEDVLDGRLWRSVHSTWYGLPVRKSLRRISSVLRQLLCFNQKYWKTHLRFAPRNGMFISITPDFFFLFNWTRNIQIFEFSANIFPTQFTWNQSKQINRLWIQYKS